MFILHIVRAVLMCCIDYPRTLREWGYRFQRNWNEDLIKHIVKAQPQLASKEDLAIYKRRWEYMFVYAEVGFARAYTSMTYWTFVRPVCHLSRLFCSTRADPSCRRMLLSVAIRCALTVLFSTLR